MLEVQRPIFAVETHEIPRTPIKTMDLAKDVPPLAASAGAAFTRTAIIYARFGRLNHQPVSVSHAGRLFLRGKLPCRPKTFVTFEFSSRVKSMLN